MHSDTHHILIARLLDQKGGATTIAENDISDHIKNNSPIWIHLDAEAMHTQTWLQREISHLDPLIAEALLSEETRPRMVQVNDGILLILRGVNLNEDAAAEDMVSVRLWIDQHRIISVRKRKLKAIWDIEEKLSKGNGPKDSGDFITSLLTKLFDRMQPTLSALDDNTDDIEEQILEHADSCLREQVIHIRKQAIMLRRYMSPQRDAIQQLRMADISWLSDKHKRHLQESLSHVTRYVEDLDAIRERAQIVKDELANMLADRLNKNMYILSVIAAIFLPLGFLTGLLGINVGGSPGTEDGNAFWIVSGGLTIIVLLQVLLFKKMKWF